MDNIKYFLPDTMTHQQEIVIEEISKQLFSYGMKEKYIREWWQTPDRSLLEARTGEYLCPLEAVCNDYYDLARMSADKTGRIFEENLKQIELEIKLRNDALLDE